MERDLRPGKSDVSQAGVPGGEYRFGRPSRATDRRPPPMSPAFRDREIVVVIWAGRRRDGPDPCEGPTEQNGLNAARHSVCRRRSDGYVDVIDTVRNAVSATIPLLARTSLLPPSLRSYTGANPDSVALSPDEKQLYVTNGI